MQELASTTTTGPGSKTSAARSKMADTGRVLLICPPFQHPRLSSISVSQLATSLRDSGVHCDEAYFHFELMRIVGLENYLAAIDRRKGFTAELLFAEALHGKLEPPWQGKLAMHFGTLDERRSILARFEARCIERLEAKRPDIVGITTSYNQLMPALWLARAIKARIGDVLIVLGGTACSEPSGRRVLEGYPDVDYVVSGYGERPLLELARGERPREGVIESYTPQDLEELPLPDYRPFMREAQEFGPPKDLRLQYQSSRGCWWGQRRHCNFCGLNGIQMEYAARPADQVVRHVRTLWERHGLNLNATDCILSRDHMKEVLPRLADFAERPWLFYEVKAGMSEDQVRTLAGARVVGQVGIETLSTRVLKLLNKGGTGIRILAFLKWCRESGTRVVWNMLHSIPGEMTEDYEQQMEVMAKIPHFQPPRNLNPIHIDRYSPYFDRHREFGWDEIEPEPQYEQAHPHLDRSALRDIAYHFRGVGRTCHETYLERLTEAHVIWKERYENGDGLFLDGDHGLIRVERKERRRIPLVGASSRIIECTHTVSPVSRVLEQAYCEIEDLERLVEKGLVHVESGKALNLTVRTRLPFRG